MNRFFNMTSKIKALFSVFSLFVIPSLFVILCSNNTYATRVEVDVHHLNDYFCSYSSSSCSDTSAKNVYASSVLSRFDGSSFRLQLTGSYADFCSGSSVYSRVVYGDGFSSFVPSSSSNGRYVYVLGQYNTGIVYYYVPDLSLSQSFDTVTVASSSSSVVSSNFYYSFQSIILGCSEEEVSDSSSTPTPTPTPTPTATPTPTPTETPTPTPTPDVIDPDDYEFDAVEDAIVKYRFISMIIIFGAGLLLYHIVIRRIILR